MSALFFSIAAQGGSGGTIPPVVSDNTVDVLLIAGQSNTGRALASALDSEYQVPVDGAKIWTGNSTKWQTVEAGENTGIDNDPDSGEFGPEVSFAMEYVAANSRELRIIKHGIGASNLGSSVKTTDWLPSLNESFLAYKNIIESALTDILISGKTYNIIAQLWMQGEEDATNEARSLDYEDNLNTLIAAIRALPKIDNATMPFIIGRINGASDASEVYRDNIRAAQAAVGGEFALIDTDRSGIGTDENAYLVDCDGYPLQDTVHYDEDGQIAFGQDVYEVCDIHGLIND